MPLLRWLAFTRLVGPAEMSIKITLSNDLPHSTDKVALVVAALLTTGLTTLTLWLARPINRLLGMTGINFATRLMALIVAAVGINFIVTGLKNQCPGLSRRTGENAWESKGKLTRGRDSPRHAVSFC
jgi:multiple antibiotic resistance protein